jgi:hypothetical protein
MGIGLIDLSHNIVDQSRSFSSEITDFGLDLGDPAIDLLILFLVDDKADKIPAEEG